MSASSSKVNGKLKPHPFSELLPMMSDAEYGALRDDIRDNGLAEPIVLYKGMILDGRNRYRAGGELNAKLKFETFKGNDDDALRYVYSKANHRNMSDSQKACAARGFLPLFKLANKRRGKASGGRASALVPTKLVQGKNRKQMEDHLSKMPREVIFNRYADLVLKDTEAKDGGGRAFKSMVDGILAALFDVDQPNHSREQAGTLFGVSGRYVSDADLIYRTNRKLFDEVFNGFIPITRAKRQVQRAHRRREMIRKAKAAPAVKDCDIITGNCLKLLERIPDKSIRLIIADPPYNIGIDYGHGAKADLRDRDEYLGDVKSWINKCKRVLTDDGSIFIVCDASYLADFEIILAGCNHALAKLVTPLSYAPIQGVGLHRRNVIAWHETFGSHQSGNFTRAWRPILYYTKSEKNFVWNADDILEPSARQTDYSDKRADPAGKVPTNVWEFPRVVDNAKSRSPDGFATQLPIELTDRIVKVASDPGDLVLDPFTGSGTSAVSAVLHGRRFKGFEIDAKRAEAARLRVRAAAAERKAS